MMKRDPSNGYIHHLIIITIIFISLIQADVRVEPSAVFTEGFQGAASVNAYNATILKFQLGGFRFFTPSYQWQSSADLNITASLQGAQMFHEARVKVSEKLELIPNGAAPAQNYNLFWWGTIPTGQNGSFSGQYVLIKFGSQGIPVDPLDEDPITLDQIDSIIAVSTYYDPDAKYLDSLGNFGGTYSGGLLDTYYGQTQIMLAIPKNTFSLSGTNINLDPSETGGPFYWMGLAAGQEYFNMDKQLLIATGFKESGIAASGLPYVSQNSGGVFGAYHVENWTCLARAVAWPHFYPDHMTALQNSPNATVFAQTVMSVQNFCGEYMGLPTTPQNSAYIVNSIVIGGLNYWYLYYLLGFAEDLCWKETLEWCIDPHIGVAALAPLYNLGMNSGSESPLHVNNYNTLLGDPNASNQFPVGNGNYRTDIINAVEALVNASQQSLTDPTVTMFDIFITLNEIQAFFFGDGGSVSSQGNGGLVKHFNIDRQKLWSDVQAAFNKLSPHWGQSPAAISWRYDFLTLLRVVKGMFIIDRPRPTDDESRMWIEARSQVGGCGVVNDNEYPFMNIGAGTMNGNDFVLPLNLTDNQFVKEVKWTTIYEWTEWWNAAFVSGSGGNQNWEVTVPNATLGADLWLWAADSAGNVIVKKTNVTGGPDYPELDSTIIQDTRGNGWGNKITIYLTPGTGNNPDDLGDYQNLEYSWPTQTNMITAIPANVTVGSNNLVINDNTFTDGAGLGKVTFDYPSATSGYTDDILDRIGPAIDSSNGVGAVYNIPDVSGVPDTLYITFTEKIKENLGTNTAYLNFKIGNGTPVATASTEANLISGTRWMFIFPAGTVGDKDSVNIVYNSGVVDTIDNVPLTINQFVPIKKIGNKEPQWVIGYIKDTQGNGMGDEITITIKTGTSDSAYQPGDCEEIRYSWPQKGNFTTATVADPNVAITGNNFVIDDNTTSGEGEGNAELDFPESIMIKGDIIDSVGPAIVSAVLNEKENAGDPDTLTVTFTEPVAENLVYDHQYLNVNGTAVTSITADKVDNAGLVWIFSFAANTVQEGDRVNLIHNSGLIDQAFYPADDKHNPPLPNNQEVVVILLKGTYKVVDGRYLDVDAEGTMDSIVMTMNKNVKQEDLDTMTFTFTWLDNSGSPVVMTVDGSDFTIFDGVKIGWEVTGYALQQYVTSVNTALGWGQATLTQPNEKTGQMETADITVGDGMGPVIFSAEYYSFNSVGIADTLIVTFSEAMSSVSEQHPFKFLTTADPEYLVAVSEVLIDSHQVTFYVVNFTDNVTPASGDSIWIYAGNNVNDAQNIEQEIVDNIKQPLGFYYAYSVLSAAYFDTSARPDGLIDLIRVKMNAVPDNFIFNNLASAIQLPDIIDYHAFSMPLAGSDFVALSDGFALYVTQSNTVINTAADDRDKLKITQNTVINDSGIIQAAEIVIADSLAPVITRAMFRPALISAQNAVKDVPDTLDVTFSEVIALPSTSAPAWPEPFLFWTVNSEEFHMEMEPELITKSPGRVMVFCVDTVLKAGQRYFPIAGDSIWLQAGEEITDMVSNTQDLDTKRIPLIVKPYEYVFDLVVFPNPFTAGDKKNDKQDVWGAAEGYNIIEGPGEQEGPDDEDLVVLLIPYGYVNNPDSISAELSIFDPVGNTLLEQTPLTYNNHEAKQAWYKVWNTKNTYGRFVGQGTYLCVVPVHTGVKVKPKTYEAMVGIRK